mgnify:CR=1 FL=1
MMRNPITRTQPETNADTKANDLRGLEKMIASVLEATKNQQKNPPTSLPDEAEHPNSSPIYWISKWVDYSDKYGIGMYKLSIFPNLEKFLFLM